MSCVQPQTQEQADQQTAFGMEYIARVLSTVGVQRWEELEGKAVRMAIQGNQILGIGNLIEDVWFYPRELGDQCQQEALERAEAMSMLRRWNATPPAAWILLARKTSRRPPLTIPLSSLSSLSSQSVPMPSRRNWLSNGPAAGASKCAAATRPVMPG